MGVQKLRGGIVTLEPQECKVAFLEDLTNSGSFGDYSNGYQSLTTDAQLEDFCGAAYAYRFLDGKLLNYPLVFSVCSSYNLIKTSSAPPCTHCK